ncbi:MAG: HlyD family secretion protein [Burkholderiaceae bacterium]
MSEAEQTSGEQARADSASGGSRKLGSKIARFFSRVLLMGVIPLAAIAGGLYFYYTGGRYISTENAYVRAETITISPDIDGRVTAVNVTNNQRVVRGSELFRLDPEPLRLMVGEAEAQVQLARVSIDTMRADYREAVASIRTARQQVLYLQRRLDRQAKLIQRGVVTAEKLDDAEHELRVAQQQVTTLNLRARRTLANLGGDINIDYDAHPAYQAAQYRLDLARTRERQTVVRAPADGVVSNMTLQAGEYVKQGQAIFSMVNDSNVWVEANLKETQLTHLEKGQRATLSIDAYPDVEWQAVVSDIAPATGAEFALLPPQNATGNWVKVVQRVPVHLHIELQPDAPRLRAGMTVTASIDTGRERGWPAPFGIEPSEAPIVDPESAAVGQPTELPRRPTLSLDKSLRHLLTKTRDAAEVK